MKTLTLAIAATFLATSGAIAAAPVKTVKSSIGDVLAGENGMTLYTYKDDSMGKSTCYDACAKNWPPFMATGNAMADGAYSIIERKDGSKQWAKDGMPLYYWIKDKKSGDATGDGMKGEWDAARP
ncbi:hypothetical protein [Sinorhizobium sp. BG8]|uniref:COG4315 family predicted lipoprotein n=1 Tax=Sinorhizobium sp. BG8 TaxID=2613773 RepID=UPI00193CE958|nr:hypothetical protein [Sinorhizobium sp. BG8]QRM55885.1 hypothetical protein F3Y30_16135 [Sinorhizobium sp. BG8]